MKKLSIRIISCMLAMLLMIPVFGSTAFAVDENTGIKVMSDGEYIDFTDAAPVLVNNRTMVPFRAIFEKLGAEVSFDTDETGNKITATLGEKTLTFYVGDKNLSITEGENTETKTMDVLSYIDTKTNRTMVPARFVAEGLGRNVSWDANQKTVVIIDFDKIGKLIDDNFSILAKTYTSDYDPDAVYTIDMNGSMNINTKVEEEAQSIALKMILNGIVSSAMYDMKMDIDMDSNIPEAGNIDGTIDYKFDLVTGNVYLRSSLFDMDDTVIGGEKITGETWIKLSLNDLFTSAYGQDFGTFMTVLFNDLDKYADVTLGEMLAECMKC